MSYPAEFGGSYAKGDHLFEYTQNLKAIRKATEEELERGQYHQG